LSFNKREKKIIEKEGFLGLTCADVHLGYRNIIIPGLESDDTIATDPCPLIVIGRW